MHGGNEHNAFNKYFDSQSGNRFYRWIALDDASNFELSFASA
jgi:hypothetical protein